MASPRPPCSVFPACWARLPRPPPVGLPRPAIGTALAAYWASMILLVLPLEWCARRIVRQRGEPVNGFGAWGWLCTALVIPLTQIVHFAALAAALFARTHRWRGVRYRFYGPTPVRVIEDLAEAA